jgi:PAS domain S-box-containing protein
MASTDERLRAALEVAGIGTWEWEQRTRRVVLSPTYERLCGLAPGTFKGTHEAFFQCVHPDDREPVARSIAEARQQRRDLHNEFRVVRPDGTVRRLENHARAVLGPDGEAVSVTSLSRDVTGQHEAEEALRAGEARYRSLVSAMAPVLWSTARDGKVLEDSPSWRAFTGQTFEAYRGFGWLDAVHPDDRDRVWEGWTEVLRARTPCETEYRARRHDGDYRDVLARAVPIVRADGQVQEWAGVVTDVTERKRAEEAMARLHRELQEKQRLMEAVLRQVPAGVIVIDTPSGTIQLVSERFRALRGSEFTPGRRYVDVARGRLFTLDGMPCPPGELPVCRAMRTGAVVEHEELLFERSEGDRMVLSINAAPLRDDGGAIYGAVATFRDITEQRRLAREVADERVRLRAVIDAMLSGVLLVEAPSGRVLYANRRAEATLGEWLGGLRELAVLVQLDARRLDGTPLGFEDYPLVRALRSGEVSRAVELVLEPTPGARLYLRNSAAPIFDGSGRISAAVWVFEDIGCEVERQQEKERVERFRELFIGMLGHDLKNPLSAMVTGAWLLSCRGTLAPEDARVAERIATSGERMVRMIGQILDLTRSRLAGGIRIDPVPTDLHALVRRIADECEAAHAGRSVRVETSGDPNGIWDPDRLAQVVCNLLCNAMEHTPAGAPVDVTVERVGPAVRLRVHNQGEPIPPEILPALFDPFHRTKQVRRAEGLGLGVYISAQIVAAHGGKIEVESRSPVGTTFTVTLPVATTGPPA